MIRVNLRALVIDVILVYVTATKLTAKLNVDGTCPAGKVGLITIPRHTLDIVADPTHAGKLLTTQTQCQLTCTSSHG